MEAKQPLTPDYVYQVIQGVTKVNSSEREQSEALLKKWEHDATPGCLDSLMQIASQPAAISEEHRLLAAVIAKNAVGSLWQQVVGGQPGSRVGTQEKEAVRSKALTCLFTDPSKAVATQMMLVVANIARYDLPHEWPSLLPSLSEEGNRQGNPRALRALKHVVRALKSKRAVPVAGNSLISLADVHPLLERFRGDMLLLDGCLEPVFKATWESWREQFRQFLDAGHNWEARGENAAIQLQVLRETIVVFYKADVLKDFMSSLMDSFFQALNITGPHLCQSQDAFGTGDARLQTFIRVWERVTQVVTLILQRQDRKFPEYIAHFLRLFAKYALLDLDPKSMHVIRPKWRLLSLAFLVRAASDATFSNPGWINSRAEDMEAGERQTWVANMQSANEAISGLYSGETCGPVVRALVFKYVAWTEEELEEWETAPEQFARNLEPEEAHNSDSTRAIAMEFLLTLLQRGLEPVSQVMFTSATEQIRLQPGLSARERQLLQEARMAALGECYQLVEAVNGLPFDAWYSSEIISVLTSAQLRLQQASSIEDRALLVRAVILVGTCGSKLPTEHWLHAYGFIVAVARHHLDKVVRLAAALSLSNLMEQAIQENEGIEEETMFMRRVTSDEYGGGGPGADLQSLLEMGIDGEAELGQRRAAYEEKVGGLAVHAQSLVQGCLVMLEVMEEIDSKVKIMRLLSLTFEVIGNRAQELLSLVADYLPRIWSSADGNSEKDTARLHSALMGLLTHLVIRIKHLATQHPHVAKVMAPLLSHALTLGRPDSDVLVEEALKLLRVVITSSHQLSPEYRELLPKVMGILQKGKERGAIFSVVEGYILLGLGEVAQTMQPYMATISQALLASVESIAAAAAAEESAGPQTRPGVLPGMMWLRSAYQEQAGKKELVQEGFFAASLISLLLQLNVEPVALAPALKLMGKLASSAGAGGHGVRVLQFVDGARTCGSVVQKFVEVLTRTLFKHPDSLAWLLDGDAKAEARLLDRIIFAASRKSLGEVLGERDVSMIGRLRRHTATACLCKLVCSNASTALIHPSRAASLLSLGLSTVKESPQFQADQENLAEALERQNRLFNERLLQVSLELAQQDAIRSCDTQAVVTAAAQAILKVCPQEEIWGHLEMIDSGLPPMLNTLLRGEYGNSSVMSLAQAMDKATL